MAKLPTVVSNLAPDLRAFVNRVREAIDGKGNDKLVTVDDLIRGGIAVPGPGGTIIPPAGGVTIATPPAPTSLSATGAIQNIIVEWDDPRYFGHAYAEVWGASTDSLGDAVLLGMTPGAIYIDAIGPGSVRYYWVRFVNTLDTAGPYNAVDGTRGETGPDVAYLLEVLTGAITETQLFSSLGARIDNIEVNTTAIQTEATIRSDADSALAEQVTTVQASVDDNTAAIQVEALARVDADNSLFAQYSVKIDTNGYVSGFGLSSTANNATPLSDFIIRADRFSIASPSGPGITPVIPFIVTTTPQTINGVTVPVGVYINGAFIQNGTITNAKIGNAAIDDAKIANLSAGKITAGSISVGSYIQSSNYLIGSQGWKIHGDGTAEFAAASIRGQLTAAQINSNGLSIRDTAGNIILNAGTGVFSGTTSSSNVTGLGDLATKDTVSAAEVSGLGDLATADSVNWNTQLTNVPAFGNFAYLSSITSANISTYIASAAIGNAYISSLSATKLTAGSIAVGQYIRSANYVSGSAGWEIDGNGDAEFNELTVRSGQVVGALLRAVKINSYSGLYVKINEGTPVSTTSGPYFLNGFSGSYLSSPPQYLVGYYTMPAPETAAHRIAAVINVQSTGGSANKDLAVLLIANGSLVGNAIYGEQVAYNTNSGVFGLATNGAGVSTNTYSTATTFAVFVGGYNADYTIQTIDGLLFGVR